MTKHILVVLVIAVLALLAGCSGHPQMSAKTTAGDSVQRVAVVQVTRQDLARHLELAAEFRPYQEIDVYAKVSGYLKAIHVDVGDRVRQGQALAELEAPEMAQELAHASATLKRTELEVERARGELQRAEANRQLREISFQRLSAAMKARPNLIAQQELDDASARFRESDAQVSAGKAALAASEEQIRVATAAQARLETMLSYLKITAPFAGVITRRLADPGAMIQAGTASHLQAMPVVRLSQLDRLRLVLPVPESIAARVRVGGPVEIRVDSLSRVFQGKISRFTGKLDSGTRTMDAEVDISNPEQAILPGMFGYATVTLDRRVDTLGVPVQAISRNASRPTVLVVNPQRQLEERRIDTGVETPAMVEVLAGLKQGELVVVGNRARLKPGMTVEPKPIEVAELAKAH